MHTLYKTTASVWVWVRVLVWVGGWVRVYTHLKATERDLIGIVEKYKSAEPNQNGERLYYHICRHIYAHTHTHTYTHTHMNYI